METGTAQILEIADNGTHKQVFSFTEPLWPWVINGLQTTTGL